MTNVITPKQTYTLTDPGYLPYFTAYEEVLRMFNSLEFEPACSEVARPAKEYTVKFHSPTSRRDRCYALHTLDKDVFDALSDAVVCLSLIEDSTTNCLQLVGFDMLNLRHIHLLAALVAELETDSLIIGTDSHSVHFDEKSAQVVRNIPDCVVQFAEHANLDISDSEVLSALLMLHSKGGIPKSTLAIGVSDLDKARACADDFVADHLFYPEFFKDRVRRTSARYSDVSVPAYAINFKSIFDTRSPTYSKLVALQEDAFLVFALVPHLTEEGPQLTLIVDTGCHHIGEGYPYVNLGESITMSANLTFDFELASSSVSELSTLFFESSRLAVQDAIVYMGLKYSMKSLVAQFKE